MESLRQQIIADQRARYDLLKWKLIIASALGGVALGLSPGTHVVPSADLMLCLIPLASAYVDLTCTHLALRIQLIAAFIRMDDLDPSGLLRRYEDFICEAGQLGWPPGSHGSPSSWMSRVRGSLGKLCGSLTPGRRDEGPLDMLGLGPLAMYGASSALALLVGSYGVWTLLHDSAGADRAAPFLVSSLVGAVAVDLIWNSYVRRLNRIKALVEKNRRARTRGRWCLSGLVRWRDREARR
jgi:hypothetical protein